VGADGRVEGIAILPDLRDGSQAQDFDILVRHVTGKQAISASIAMRLRYMPGPATYSARSPRSRIRNRLLSKRR